MEKDNENKINKKDLIIKIVLIIIIILLLSHNCSIIKNGFNNKNDGKSPTGNVDIFEIQCDKDACEVDDKNRPIDNRSNDNSVTTIDNTNTKPVNGSDNGNSNNNNSTGQNNSNNSSSNANDEDLVVTDSNTTWSSTNNLRIFSNPVYSMNDKIAPESSNIYQFVVRNNTKYNVKYSLKFIEDNYYSINMKYRLKRGKSYIVGNDNTWVDYNDLNLSNIQLNSSSNHTYYLEWKWVSSDNDTEVGNTLNAVYKLDIDIKAEGTSE